MNKTISFSTGLIIGFFTWLIIPIISGGAEPWDSHIGNFIANFFPAIVALVTAFRYGLVKMLFSLLGVYLGGLLYMYLFSSGDQRGYFLIGVVTSLVFYFYPLVSGVFGWILGLLYRKFASQQMQKVVKNADTLLDKLNMMFADKSPLFYYTATTKSAVYKLFIAGLVFSVSGIMGVIYPVPPFNPVPLFVLKTIKILGWTFIVGSLWFFYRTWRMYSDTGKWEIVVNETMLHYKTPKHSREKSFDVPLDEIEYIKISYPDNDATETSTLPICQLYTSNDRVYDFSWSESNFKPAKLVDVLQNRGVLVNKTY